MTGWDAWLNDNSRCWRILQSIFDVFIHGHLMGCCINEQLFVKVRGKADIEAAFECNFGFLSFCFAGSCVYYPAFSIGMLLIAALFRIISNITGSISGHTFMPMGSRVIRPAFRPLMFVFLPVVIYIMENDLVSIFQIKSSKCSNVSFSPSNSTFSYSIFSLSE